MKKQKTLLLILLLTFAISIPTSMASVSKEAKAGASDAGILNEKQKELGNIYMQLGKNKEKLKETKKQEQSVINKLFVITRDLKITKGQLSRAQTQITVNEKRIGYLQTTMEDAKKRMDSRATLLSRRLKEIYKNGGVNYIELLITSNTLSDFINRTYFFEKMLGRDAKLMGEINIEHTKIKESKFNLEGMTKEIKGLARIIETKKKNIESQEQEKKQVYKMLEKRKKEYEKNIADLEKSSEEIEQMIKQLLAERAKKGLSSPRGTGSISWPLHGRLTSFFGYRRDPFRGGTHMHTGLDIAAPYGSPIKAADSGEVIYAGWWNGYGKTVIIDHGKSISTLYGHMSRIYVEKGAIVTKGQVVGLVGSTGWSTGPHCHFEVRKKGAPTNPLKWLP